MRTSFPGESDADHDLTRSIERDSHREPRPSFRRAYTPPSEKRARSLAIGTGFVRGVR